MDFEVVERPPPTKCSTAKMVDKRVMYVYRKPCGLMLRCEQPHFRLWTKVLAEATWFISDTVSSEFTEDAVAVPIYVTMVTEAHL